MASGKPASSTISPFFTVILASGAAGRFQPLINSRTTRDFSLAHKTSTHSLWSRSDTRYAPLQHKAAPLALILSDLTPALHPLFLDEIIHHHFSVRSALRFRGDCRRSCAYMFFNPTQKITSSFYQTFLHSQSRRLPI